MIQSPLIFHVYNRSNDRNDIFKEDQNYDFFISKMIRQLPKAAHILGYCLMPNHFHILLTPLHPIRENYSLDGEIHNTLPTPELSEAIKRLLMGYTKSYNKFYNVSGSRFRQKTNCKFHSSDLRNGLHYLHQNPVKAGLVKYPAEWAHSSFNEYHSEFLENQNTICNLQLGKKLLL